MPKIDKDLVAPAVEPASEKAHRVTKAALAAIPAAGGTLVEAFCALIESPINRRRTEWMIQVTEAMNELFESGLVTEESLVENESFFTTLVHASNVAIRNHEQTKLEALRNAVLNSALPAAPDVTEQQLFLNFVDTCTSWHIALLTLFQNPERWARENDKPFPKWSMGGLTSVIEHAYPALRSQKELYRLIWSDLFRNGMVNTDGLGTTMTGPGVLAKRTTSIGDKFVDFISRPAI